MSTSAAVFAVNGPARAAPRGVRRIAFVGGESSGKSTLATALARRYDEPVVAEYGRTLWEEQGGQGTYDDLLKVGVTHVAHEDAALETAKRCVFIDTTPLTTLWYSLDGHRRAAAELVGLSWRLYDLTIVCTPDFGFVQDGMRASDDFRLRHHRWLRAMLGARGITYREVSGPADARVAQVAGWLDPYFEETA
jgi:HTH-type transcriptional regulator, transcriptional repressor of NAD biosynthesis genes